MKRTDTMRPHLVIWGLFLAAFLLRGLGLSAQPPLADELLAAQHAVEYGKNGLWHADVMWQHPPLRNLVIFASGKLFGVDSAWGVRFGSVFLGSLSVPLLGYLAWSLCGSVLAGYLAAFFLCVDPMHLALSRQAFQESMTPCFVLAGVIATWHGIRKNNIFFCYLAGALFGLATASKWHGLFPWFCSAAAYLSAPWLSGELAGERHAGSRLVGALAAFVAVPLVCYTATFLPWFSRGHSMAEFLDFQLFLAREHYNHIAPSAYVRTYLSDRAIQWFLWPAAWVDMLFMPAKHYMDIAIGNFLVWVLTLPSLYWSVQKWRRQRDFGHGFAIALFFACYLPLVATTRAVYPNSALAVIPFAFVLVAAVVADFRERGRVSSRGLAIYLALVVTLSALMYPLSTLRALDYPYLKPIADIYTPHGGFTTTPSSPLPSP